MVGLAVQFSSALQKSGAVTPDVHGCQIFVDKIYQNGEKYTKSPINYQGAIKYTKCPKYIPNGVTFYQLLSLQVTPKFTQSWIFGLKIYHLATLTMSQFSGHMFDLDSARVYACIAAKRTINFARLF
jgi:hypothetical protein